MPKHICELAGNTIRKRDATALRGATHERKALLLPRIVPCGHMEKIKGSTAWTRQKTREDGLVRTTSIQKKR